MSESEKILGILNQKSSKIQSESQVVIATNKESNNLALSQSESFS